MKRAIYFMVLLCAVLSFAHHSSAAATEVGDFATLKTNIESGGDIKLKQDIAVSNRLVVPSGKTVTLDLNGHRLYAASADAIANKGTLTISDSGSGGTLSADKRGSAAVANFPDGTVTLLGGTYISSNWYVIKNLGTMTISGDVTVKKPDGSTDTSSLIANGWYDNADTIAGESQTATADKAKMYIKSGSFSLSANSGTKSMSTLKNDDYGYLEIEGGTFNSTNNSGGENAATLLNWNIAKISGGTFIGSYPLSNGAYANEADKGQVTITGGTFLGRLHLNGMGKGGSGKGLVKITGGVFSGDIQAVNGAGGYSFDISGGVFNKNPSAFMSGDNTVSMDLTDLGATTFKYGVLSPTVTISADESKTYDGSGIILTAVPDPVKMASYDISSKYTYQWKKDNTDISGATSSTYTTDPGVSSGSYTVTATTGGKSYSSEAKTVAITAADISGFTMTVSPETVSYDGNAKTPTVTIKNGDTALTADTDYTLAFTDNTEAGTATATATGAGNYTGTLTGTFTISATDISGFTMTISPETVSYDGNAKTPTVTIKNGDTALTADTDYTLAFSNNTEAGTATVTATGKGNYTGTLTGTFTITSGSGGDTTATPKAGTPTTTTDSAGNAVISRQTVFTRSSGEIIMSADIAITLASTDLTAKVSSDFSQKVSVDVTLQLADTDYTAYAYTMTLTDLPDWLKATGTLTSTDTAASKSYHHEFVLAGVPASVDANPEPFSLIAEVTVSGDTPVLTASADCDVKVSVVSADAETDENVAPVLSGTNLTQTAALGNAITTITITATSGDNITWTASGDLPLGIAIASADKTFTISGTVNASAEVKAYTYKVIASNDVGVASVDVSITVTGGSGSGGSSGGGSSDPYSGGNSGGGSSGGTDTSTGEVSGDNTPSDNTPSDNNGGDEEPGSDDEPSDNNGGDDTPGDNNGGDEEPSDDTPGDNNGGGDDVPGEYDDVPTAEPGAPTVDLGNQSIVERIIDWLTEIFSNLFGTDVEVSEFDGTTTDRDGSDIQEGEVPEGETPVLVLPIMVVGESKIYVFSVRIPIPAGNKPHGHMNGRAGRRASFSAADEGDSSNEDDMVFMDADGNRITTLTEDNQEVNVAAYMEAGVEYAPVITTSDEDGSSDGEDEVFSSGGGGCDGGFSTIAAMMVLAFAISRKR